MERKVEATTGDQVTVPVYWAVAVMLLTGVAPVTGAVTPASAARDIGVPGFAAMVPVESPLPMAFIARI